jgi:hypothetical protein
MSILDFDRLMVNIFSSYALEIYLMYLVNIINLEEWKWRCQNCQSYMCEKCKNIHQREQTTIEHKIIYIKTCGGVVDIQPTVICHIGKNEFLYYIMSILDFDRLMVNIFSSYAQEIYLMYLVNIINP